MLVIDDSAFMRKLISDFLNDHPEIDVVGTARNGQDGLDKIQRFKPHVVTLDIEMPVLDGLETLKKIMKDHPLPVIMLSSTTKAGAKNTILSLQYGAFDFIPKPSGAISLDLHKVKDQIVEKVLQAANASRRLKTVHHKEQEQTITVQPVVKRIPMAKKNDHVLVGIGTSTGGPRALQMVIPHLPNNRRASYFVAQHMPKGFTQSLAERLNEMSELQVKEAENGEIVQKGVVYVAPGGQHLKIIQKGASLQIVIVNEDHGGYRPSVDLLFESMSKLLNYDKVAVIMTGMGYDGTKGLKALKESGNVTTIAQSEESSIIFGMPKSAIEANVIDHIVDLKDIPQSIQSII